MRDLNSKDYLLRIEELETIRNSMKVGSIVYKIVSDRIETYQNILN
jgi:hypothetical protein